MLAKIDTTQISNLSLARPTGYPLHQRDVKISEFIENYFS